MHLAACVLNKIVVELQHVLIEHVAQEVDITAAFSTDIKVHKHALVSNVRLISYCRIEYVECKALLPAGSKHFAA